MIFLIFGYITTLVVVYYLIKIYFERLEIGKLEKKPILITGCDSGFGKLLALRCLARGMPVFAACLTENGMDSLHQEAKQLPGQLYTIRMDVSKDESVKQAYKYVCQHLNGGGLHAIVNNAGIAGNTLSDDFLAVDDYKNTAEVNTWGVIRVTQAFKPLVKMTRGRIVTIASMLDRVAIPNIGPYTVSKYAVSAYCDIIRRELYHFGVSVHVLEPGFFQTAITDQKITTSQMDRTWERASDSLREEYGLEYLMKTEEQMREFLAHISSPNVDLVVDALFHALTAQYPRTRYVIGKDANFIFIPFSYLSSDVQDAIVALANYLRGAPKPAATNRQPKIMQ